MTYTIDSTERQSAELADYVDYVASSVDLRDPDAVLGSADALRALANNRGFLIDQVNRELADWARFQQGSPYGAQSLILGSGKGFLVRANMWVPPAAGSREWEDEMFNYEIPHDHNFSFLTVGYLGAGYRTRIWEYDPDSVVGRPGEHVDLTFLEETTLPVGKIMYYRACRDVHAQARPPELSVSLNLLVNGPQALWGSQLYFDPASSTITDFAQNLTARRVMLCELAGLAGDGRSAELLEHLASRHPAPQLRWSAYEALLDLEGARSEEILHTAAQDPDRYVHTMARDTLGERGGAA